jgi:hypothetical protein
MDGDRTIRVETDEDGDGLIDLWEYYGSDNTVEKIGVSSTGDGRVDTWRAAGPSEAGEEAGEMEQQGRP